jgi:acyl CoA:acetate/3-ketoacid CoA transferase beta subunit
MLSALVRRVIIFTAAHNRRLFVPKVDFVNATATDDAPWRRGGLSHVVTPLCTMAFDAAKKEIGLKSLFPGVSLEEVVGNTGFDLGIGDRTIPVINPLTDEELATLRGPVQERMRRIYPQFAASVWGS